MFHRAVMNNFLTYQASRLSTGSNGLTPENRSNAISRIRSKREAKELAYDNAYDMYRQSGFSGTFLEYLMEHWDEIFKMIQQLISLFGL